MKTQIAIVLSLTALIQPAVSAGTAHAEPPTTTGSSLAAAPGRVPPAAAANYGKLPLSFEANQGQTDSQVRFQSRGAGYSLFLTQTGAILALTKGSKSGGKQPLVKNIAAKTDFVRMEFAGGQKGLPPIGVDELPGKANYFIGKDPDGWRTDVPTYSKVKYRGVYPGVDLIYYGNQQQLEYDFIVAPGADSKRVRLHFAGVEKLRLSADGDLTIKVKNGAVAFHKPVVYQIKDGQRQNVEGSFALLAGNTVGFRLGAYDHSRELVIDPVLAYSTYLAPNGPGGFGGNFLLGMTVDHNGCAYLTGYAQTYFPTTGGSFQPSRASSSQYVAVVTKMNPGGTALIYSTYLGGPDVPGAPVGGGSAGNSVAVDQAGNAYVAGFTYLSFFPVTSGAFQTINKNPSVPGTGFATKLNPSGSGLIYSTYLGGSAFDQPNHIAVDASGNAYIAGSADSTDFPVTSGAYQISNNASSGNSTGFVAKLNATGTALIYSTYLGGSVTDTMESLYVDRAGHAFVTGQTSSPDFPTTAGAFQTSAPGLGANTLAAFVTKLDVAGSALLFSTFLTSTSPSSPASYDGGYGIAADDAGNVYVAGSVVGTGFPTTAGAFQSVSMSNSTGFVTKLNSSGSALVYSTFLGGSEGSYPEPLAVDDSGNAYVAGVTLASDFPVTSDAFQKTNMGGATGNGFFTELNVSGSALVYSSYLGGAYSDCSALALDGLNNAYVAGFAQGNFPTTPGAFQAQGGGGFISKFALNGVTSTALSSSANPQVVGEPVTFTAQVTPKSGSGIPSGIVGFVEDGKVFAHGTLDGTGSASYTTSSLSPGNHAIVASYEGAPGSYSSSNGVLSQVIDGGKVATPYFSYLGGTYPVNVNVTIGTATAGATIHYTTNGATPTPSSATYTAPFVVSGTTTVKAIATLAGDTSSAVASATYTVVPAANATTTAIASSANPSTLGQSVTFTATVSPVGTGPTPTGSVSFKNGSVVVGTVPLVGGMAKFTISGLSLYGHSIAAIYTGSSTYAASGIGFTQEVQP